MKYMLGILWLSLSSLRAEPVVNLEKGTTWIYDVRLDSAEPLGISKETEKKNKDNRYIYGFKEKRMSAGEKMVSGVPEEVHFVKIFLNDSEKPREEQYYSFKNGVYASMGAKVKSHKGDSLVLLASPMPFFFKDAAPGVHWKWGDYDKEFMFRVITEEEVTTPAGVFQTLKIQMDHTEEKVPKRKRIYWFARGIGPVKEQEDLYLSKGVVLKKSWVLSQYVSGSEESSPEDKEE